MMPGSPEPVAARASASLAFASKIQVGEQRLDTAAFVEVCRGIGVGPHAVAAALQARQL